MKLSLITAAFIIASCTGIRPTGNAEGYGIKAEANDPKDDIKNNPCKNGTYDSSAKCK